MDLLGNAADAVEGAADWWIALTARAGDAAVTIIVRDRGPGVAHALTGRIFDPFFTTKGSGALFRVRLPIARVDRVAA